ncbi:hypothetical protein ACF09Y_26750 [Streptomyces massasporeus]|uniref:hypothetical protein n=1 Tax=Streptomyces massasporeus TaxID=67324 RepID=UPI003700333A
MTTVEQAGAVDSRETQRKTNPVVEDDADVARDVGIVFHYRIRTPLVVMRGLFQRDDYLQRAA